MFMQRTYIRAGASRRRRRGMRTIWIPMEAIPERERQYPISVDCFGSVQFWF
jgi:hypothetical protein